MTPGNDMKHCICGRDITFGACDDCIRKGITKEQRLANSMDIETMSRSEQLPAFVERDKYDAVVEALKESTRLLEVLYEIYANSVGQDDVKEAIDKAKSLLP